MTVAILVGFDRQSRYWPKAISLRPGYGERKVAREQAALPLFANDPTLIRTAEEYERNLAAALTTGNQWMRRLIASQWRFVRRWLRAASEADRAEFFRCWRYLPRDPSYAADIITHIVAKRDGITPLEAYKMLHQGLTVGGRS